MKTDRHNVSPSLLKDIDGLIYSHIRKTYLNNHFVYCHEGLLSIFLCKAALLSGHEELLTSYFKKALFNRYYLLLFLLVEQVY